MIFQEYPISSRDFEQVFLTFIGENIYSYNIDLIRKCKIYLKNKFSLRGKITRTRGKDNIKMELAFFILIVFFIGSIVLSVGSNREKKRKIAELDYALEGKSNENKRLTAENQNFKREIVEWEGKIRRNESTIAVLEDKLAAAGMLTAEEKKQTIAKLDTAIYEMSQKIDTLKKSYIEIEEEMLFQSFGLYQPQYELAKSELYKEKLEFIRLKQRDMIKNDKAVSGNLKWSVNGSKVEGYKIVKDMQKLLLRAFNCECEEIIDRVKYNNFDASLKRITVSYEAISKLGKNMNVEITMEYYTLKIEELHIALEYQQKKQQEKEEQKELRAQIREDAKLQKEIEDQRKKIEKEQNHYQGALSKLILQIEKASDAEKVDLMEKKSEIESKLADSEKALADVDYRQANQKAGYVYIISNVGAFGEGVYKIGMTRRLDPQERIDELGDASVPFNFDVHAMIFCDDAPALENALHKAFEDKKLNWVNTRREFFKVNLDEIKEVVKKNYSKTADFNDLAEAEQYRVSEKMKIDLTGQLTS